MLFHVDNVDNFVHNLIFKNQVMHKVIHIIHMEKHVDELIYIMGIETNVLVIVMKM